MAGESAGINSLKCLMPHFKSAMAAGKTETSNLHKTFPNLLPHSKGTSSLLEKEERCSGVETNLAKVTKKL